MNKREKKLLKSNIFIYFILLISLCFIFLPSAHAKIFFCATVGDIRDALTEAQSNGRSDVIGVLPGDYFIDSPLTYTPESTENYRLLIGGLPIPSKPVFNGHDSSQIMIVDHRNFAGAGTPDNRAEVFIADIAFANGYHQGSSDPHNASGGLSVSTYQADIRIISCMFDSNNSQNGMGAGAYLSTAQGGNIFVNNNIFFKNINPGGDGGGLGVIFDNPCQVHIVNNSFIDNYSEFYGGGASINYAKWEHGSDDQMPLYMYNNIFLDNSSLGGMDVHILDPNDLMFNQIYNNRITDVDINLTPMVLDASNWDLDPLLNPDFTLDSSSPCIDTGSHMIDNYKFPILAYYINYRVQDGNLDGSFIVDRGATEFKTTNRYHNPSYYRFIPNFHLDDQILPQGPQYYLKIGDVTNNSDKNVGWTINNHRYFSEGYSLYYGNPDAGNYNTGKRGNKGVVKIKDIDLKKMKTPVLSFMLYMDTERGDYRDTLKVFAKGKLVWEKNKNTVEMKKWQLIEIGLEKFAGQTITLEVEFDTIDSNKNNTEGVYINELTIQ